MVSYFRQRGAAWCNLWSVCLRKTTLTATRQGGGASCSNPAEMHASPRTTFFWSVELLQPLTCNQLILRPSSRPAWTTNGQPRTEWRSGFLSDPVHGSYRPRRCRCRHPGIDNFTDVATLYSSTRREQLLLCMASHHIQPRRLRDSQGTTTHNSEASMPTTTIRLSKKSAPSRLRLFHDLLSPPPHYLSLRTRGRRTKSRFNL